MNVERREKDNQGHSNDAENEEEAKTKIPSFICLVHSQHRDQPSDKNSLASPLNDAKFLLSVVNRLEVFICVATHCHSE